MTLRGLTVAVTSCRRGRELAQLIENFGGACVVAPTVGIEATDETRQRAADFARELVRHPPDYAIFLTGPGVQSLFAIAGAIGLRSDLQATLQAATVVARSPKPKKVLTGYGVQTDLVPQDNTARGIADELASRSLSGKLIAILGHGSCEPVLKENLERAGAKVVESSAYTYSGALPASGAQILEGMGFDYVPPDPLDTRLLIERLDAGTIDAITFTSPPSARNLFERAEEIGMLEEVRRSLNERVIVVAIGPSTRDALEREGVSVDVMPSVYRMGPMVRALDEFVARSRASERGSILAEKTAEVDVGSPETQRALEPRSREIGVGPLVSAGAIAGIVALMMLLARPYPVLYHPLSAVALALSVCFGLILIGYVSIWLEGRRTGLPPL